MGTKTTLKKISTKEIDESSLPLILRRGINKEEYFHDGEVVTDGGAKTGTWSDCDQD